MSKKQWAVVAWLAGAAVIFAVEMSNAKGWDSEYVESLPDSSLASVETGTKGKKALPLPLRDAARKADAAHLRSSLRLGKLKHGARPKKPKTTRLKHPPKRA